MSFFRRIRNRAFINFQTAGHHLNYLFWECTLRCNLSCLHCGSDCKIVSDAKDMPFEDFLHAISPLSKMNSIDQVMVVLTGGEPLMRDDIPEIGLALRKAGFRWSMVTNGLKYTPEMHSKLLASGMGAITISLDGLSENHNFFRGNLRSFSSALNAIKLVSTSTRLNSDVVTCVHEKNIDELDDIYQLLISNGVKTWRLFTISPIGRAREHDFMTLSRVNLKKLMDFIVEKRQKRDLKIGFSCEAYVGAYEYKVRDTAFFCRAGINIASVLADGSVSACPNISHEFIQGNIYQDSLPEIWENRFKEFRTLSLKKNGKCKHCNNFVDCRGGAMHLRNREEGNFFCHSARLGNKKNSR